MTSSKNLKNNTILLVCKDSGAANALSCLSKECKDSGIQFFNLCIGNAANVFKKNSIKPTKEYPRDITKKEISLILQRLKPKAVILGTSHDSTTERIICSETRKKKIFCLSFIDWWSNFGARFSTPNTYDLRFLPDMITVADQDALDGCVADGIPKKLIRITGNPYWDYLNLKKERKKMKELGKKTRKKLRIPENRLIITVFSSNIRNLNLNLGYDEHDFWKAMSPLPAATSTGASIFWLLKPHPREDRKDLEKMLKKYRINISIIDIDKFSAEDVIAASDIAIGMCSSTLFEAALLGKKVISLQPNMNLKRLGYLRIFNHLGITTITKVEDTKLHLNRLLNRETSLPDLKSMPSPVCDGNASSRLIKLVEQGIKIKEKEGVKEKKKRRRKH